MGLAMTTCCKIERPDPQTLFNRYLELFSNTVLGGATIIPESNEWYAASVNYAIAEEFYAISEQAWKERDPRTACCENLIALAAADGVYPLPASFAQGFIKVTGIPGAALPAPLEFTVGSLTYVTAAPSQQPNQIGPDGTAVIRVRSLTAGEIGNQALQTGTLNQNLPGVNKPVEVCGASFCNGAPAESCEAFRARYLRRLRYQPRATNVWIRDKLLEWPCATRALQRAGSCCKCSDCEPAGECGCRECGGKLEFYVMFDNTFPCGIAPQSVIDEINLWMFGSPQGYGLGQVEVGICGAIVPVRPIPINVFLDISDCVSTSQLKAVDSLIREFFTTIEPSQPLWTRTLDALLVQTLGAQTNFAVRFELVNDSDRENAYVDGCGIEPDCDYLPCLNELTIVRPEDVGFC
jgi:hypothetical protein